MKLGRILKSVGGAVALAGVSFAANMTAAELISTGSPICGILGLLPYGGALLFVTGGSIAGYHYMKGDMESRQMAKFKLEGIMLGAGLLLLLPMLAQYVFGFGVCIA